MQRKLLSLWEILKIKSLTAAPEKIKHFGNLGNQFLLKMKRKNTKTLFILIFCPLVFFILSRFVPQDKHTVLNALKNIQRSVDSREPVRVFEERKNSEITDAEIISDHQDLQTTICPTVTVTQQQRQNESEEIELETCKSYDELPLNWKNDEPWHIGFVRAPKCPPRELIILINTAQKHTVNRNLLRNYFTGKSFPIY